ncbi:MAG: DUF3368 domain-containing protein [Armatimonadota bacterium]|nr:DUF3368 domain-containing protein [Armatimonadota bacterium]
MIVVSDTGPLNYLLQIEAIEILPALYGSVILPEIVRQELLHPNAPEIVRTWAGQLPDWVVVRQPQSFLPLLLDEGERAAISLAVEIQAELILVDERRGRQAAEAQALAVTGTLGILANAARNGLLNFAEAIARLNQTSFYIAPELLAKLLHPEAAE